MSELSLAHLRVIADLIIGDFIKWCKTMPPDQLTNFLNARRCPVALYINAHTDPHVVDDYTVVANILVPIDLVWGVTHVTGTPILEALHTSWTYGGLVEQLAPLEEAMPIFDETFAEQVGNALGRTRVFEYMRQKAVRADADNADD